MLDDVDKLRELCSMLLPNTSIKLENKTDLVNSIYSVKFEPFLCSNVHTKKAVNEEFLEVKSTNLKEPPAASADDVWIFGYGSLMWKADFHYIDCRRGYICGFQRRFYQNSIDHRGTHERPGRVVTLLPTEDNQERVYGVAYRIAAAHKQDVLSHLDHREKNGYERRQVKFYEYKEIAHNTEIAMSFDIILYIATHTNDSYAGSICEIPHIAEQIFTSAGPSGANRDYLFHLAATMRQLFPDVNDEHLFALEHAVRERIEHDEPAILESVLKKQIHAILDAIANDKQQIADALNNLDNLKNILSSNGWRETVLLEALTKHET